ncbi:DUF6374 family protein [Nocardia mexicana]|uniref:Uncharacterized protein n=1 Tax=Nocardia mexicana TaxID=279262 RepID=A0A370GJG3_9NOCA|nr:DUF6374 family protein [Nocardia mexicana]RDI43825.1 hypothetical protein DFR68_1183 [Nocardia mexicana]
MPLDRHIHLAQLWLEQVRDHLASSAATSTNLSAEQLNVMSGKVAEGLRIFTELAGQPSTDDPPDHGAASRSRPTPPARRPTRTDPRYPAIPPWHSATGREGEDRRVLAMHPTAKS